MYHPTTRVLTILELLQSHRALSGPEIAERLEVDIRTVRRYIAMLQDLGIPVEGERGRYGRYRLRPGFKLPPLMFTEDEALAITLGLLVTRRMGMGVAAPAIEGALAKVEQVMPDTLRKRVRAIQQTLIMDIKPSKSPPESDVVLAISTAVQARRRVWLRYRAYAGEETEREFDPYGLVFRDTFWYGWLVPPAERAAHLPAGSRRGDRAPRGDLHPAGALRQPARSREGHRPDSRHVVGRCAAGNGYGDGGSARAARAVHAGRGARRGGAALLEQQIEWFAHFLMRLGVPFIIQSRRSFGGAAPIGGAGGGDGGARL
jgi:biotin operon repressor